MKTETDPIKMREMEQKARQLIGTLKPNTQEPYWSALLLIGATFMAIAFIKGLLTPNSVEGLWDGITLLGVFSFLVLFLRGFEIFSTKIVFDANGIQINPWMVGPKRNIDWNEIVSCKQIWLGMKFETSNGDSIKYTHQGKFAANLHDSFKIYKFRYLLEE